MKLSYVLFILFVTLLSVLGHSLHNRRTLKLSTVPYSFLRITEYNPIHLSPNNTMKEESITEKPSNAHLPLSFDLHRDALADESMTSIADVSSSPDPNPSSYVESVESVETLSNEFSPTSGSSETAIEFIGDSSSQVVNTTSVVENENENVRVSMDIVENESVSEDVVENENESEGKDEGKGERNLDKILFSKTSYSSTPYPEQEEMLREVLHYNINYNDTSIQSRDWDLVVCTTYEGVVSDDLMLSINNRFIFIFI